MDVETDIEAPAIRALGSLFKLTEVFLWDDASVETKEGSSLNVHHGSSSEFILQNLSYHNDTSLNIDSTINEYIPSSEDMELTEQMNALGLPVLFQTTKDKRTGSSKGKRKGTRFKQLSVHKESEEIVPGLSTLNEGEFVPAKVFQDTSSVSLCCRSAVGQSETSCSNIAVDINKSHCLSAGGEDSASSSTWVSNAVEEQVCNKATDVVENSGMDYDLLCTSAISKENTNLALSPINLDTETSAENAMQAIEQYEISTVCRPEGSFVGHRYAEGEKFSAEISNVEPQVPGLIAGSQSSAIIDHAEFDSSKLYGDYQDLGDWRIYWDSSCMKNYFYNFKTHESTWYPPLGVGQIALEDSTVELSAMTTDMVEIDETTGVSCYGNKLPHLQDKAEPLEKVCIDDSLSGQAPDDHSCVVDLAAGSVVSSVALHNGRGTSECLDEQDRMFNFSEIKDHKDEASLYSLTNTQDHGVSFANETNQLGSAEVGRSNLKLVCINSETDKPDFSRLAVEPEMTTSSMDVHNLCDDLGLQASDSDSLSTIITDAFSEEKWTSNLTFAYTTSTTDVLDSQLDSVTIKRKKKVRRTRSWRKLSNDNKEFPVQELLEECSADVVKYWCKRYLLFSRFDDGIKMDTEGWFSVTPEAIARHHAIRCGGGIVIDCFTGVGGNAIQFAKRSNYVVAIDIDQQKIDYARHNAAIYGVDDRIDFIKGDSFQLAPSLKADTVFLSPPWGGPDYAKVQTYDIETMLKPHGGHFLFTTVRKIAPRIVIFLPRNVDLNQLAELSLSVSPELSLEVEKNFLNGRLKAITAYFTDTSV